jgi:hypothetical protein
MNFSPYIYRSTNSEKEEKDMGAYLVRYTTEDGTFYHNANALAENLREQASGAVSPALVIHDEWEAKRLAEYYRRFSRTVEVLECKLAVGSMVYHGPPESFTRNVGFDSDFGE